MYAKKQHLTREIE